MRISFWHPFTAAAVGLEEADLIPSHSRPFVNALRKLSEGDGYLCEVNYLTTSGRRRQIDYHSLKWNFWPLSFRRFRSSSVYRRQWSIRALVDAVRDPPDVSIYYHSGLGSSFSRSMGLAIGARGKPYVFFVGGQRLSTSKNQIAYFRRAAALAFLSPEQANVQVTHPVLHGIRTVVIEPGADTETFKPDPVQREHAPRLLLVGRVVRTKRVEIAIDAATAARQVRSDVVLDIVGPEPDPEYSEALRRRVRAQAMTDAVNWHGMVPHEDLPRWYAAAALSLFPTSSEGYGFVAQESMACGTPVIAIQGSGISIIDDGIDGRVVEESRFARAVAELVERDDVIASMSERARAKIVTQHGVQRTADQIRQVIELATAR